MRNGITTIRRFIEKMCGKAKADRIVHWWCNPGRGTVIFIFVALIMCVLGTVMVSNIILNVNETIKASDESMAQERAVLRARIDFLDDFMRRHSHTGRDFPDEGT